MEKPVTHTAFLEARYRMLSTRSSTSKGSTRPLRRIAVTMLVIPGPKFYFMNDSWMGTRDLSAINFCMVTGMSQQSIL